MPSGPRWTSASRLAAAVALLLLAVAGARARDHARLGMRGLIGAGAGTITGILGFVLVVIASIVLAGLVVLLARRRRRQDDEHIPVSEPAGTWWQQALALLAVLALAALLVAAVVATATPCRWQRWAIGLLAAVFFIFLYMDERALNGFEDQMRDAVAQLPPMARVVSNADADLRINALTHTLDRVCIGRCYSYANYEPSSGQFRIRVTGPASMVAPTDMDSSRMQNGGYAVKERDLPLYRISVSADGSLAIDSLPAGALIGVSRWSGLWELP